MELPKKLLDLIAMGRQVGLRLTVPRHGQPYYVSAALQKVAQVYHTDLCLIREDKMVSEDFEIDERREFARLEDALAYLGQIPELDLSQMKTFKGQKAFKP